MEDKWWSDKAELVQQQADNGNNRELYQELKCMYGPSSSQHCPLFAADNTTMLTEQSDIPHGLKEHFEHLLSQSSIANNSVLNHIKQQPILHTADKELSKEEVLQAARTMMKGKAVHETAYG